MNPTLIRSAPVSRAFYNEHDPKAAAWLRELIAGGHIAPGVVDERGISDLTPDDLHGFTQCHFFAGIGGWSLGLRLAGVPDDEPLGTGSCPCQPFSDAGKGLGEADPRHLWPAWFRLIAGSRERGQPWTGTLFGEQVASKAVLGWLDGVFADLEGAGYACGAADLCAAGVGAPHIRQRLFWVAESEGFGWGVGPLLHEDDKTGNTRAGDGGGVGRLGDAHSTGSLTGRQAATSTGHGSAAFADGGTGRVADSADDRCAEHGEESRRRKGKGPADAAERGGAGDRLGDAGDAGLERYAGDGARGDQPGRDGAKETGSARPAGGAGAWDAFDLLPCSDGKARRVESGTFPLAHGVSGGVGLLRGYGNAIVPEAAAEFILAYRGAREARREPLICA